jgi:hypothetical protein
MPFFRQDANMAGNVPAAVMLNRKALAGKVLTCRNLIRLGGILAVVLLFFLFVNEHTVKPVSTACNAEFLV